MYQVTKRDGTAAQFEIGKISAAITKAFEALEKQYHPSVIDMLALRVTADFEPKIRDGQHRGGGHPGQRGEGAVRGGLRRCGQGLHPLPQAAGEGAQCQLHPAQLQGAGGQLPPDQRLAGEGELHRHLLGGRADPVQLRRHHRQLLAQRDLRPGGGQRPPQRRDPYPRPVHAHRLLRRLVSEAAYPGGAGGHPGEDHLLPGQPPVHPVQPDGQLPGHHAERVGRGPGVLLL